MVMSITAAEIQQVKFAEVRKGYDPDEVDEFLERLAVDVDTLNRAIAEAANRIKSAEEQVREAEAKLAQQSSVAAAPVALEPEARATSSASAPVSEDAISKAFIAAQVSADRLKEEARKEAEKLYREADSKAKDIVRDAHSEKQRTVAEIDKLREISEKFRTDFLSLVNHYSVDAQKRFPAFDELIPEGSGSGTDAGVPLFTENDAVVQPAAAPVATAAPAAARPASAAPAAVQVADELGATTMMPAAATLTGMDDDLEIEEID
jgi:cell division initiation protein